MPHITPALSAPGPSRPFETVTLERRDLRDDDILIDIAYAGICHSDIHTVRDEWGAAHYPLTPGHEIAGVVAAVGPGVTRHKVGDRVGVGCMVDSCGECEQCKDGFEQFCTRPAVFTYNTTDYDGEITQGGYARQIVVTERFALRIPDGIGLDEAAPLLCAGITTYSPLKRWDAAPGVQVAVVGVGGLGHMGVKLAAALGATVTTISRTTDKADDAMALGSTRHIASSEPEAMRAARGTLDVILNTVSADLDMEAYLALLKPNGVMVNVGLPAGRYAVRPGSLVGRNRVLAGSNIGGLAQTQEMLDFCAEHGLGATIETISADEVDEAYDKVVAGEVRYRYVIDTATIGATG